MVADGCRWHPTGQDHVVPCVVGNYQAPLVEHPREPRLAAAMRCVGAGVGVNARDEQRIRALDRELLRLRECVASSRVADLLLFYAGLDRAGLNVLRTVAEDFLRPHLDRVTV